MISGNGEKVYIIPCKWMANLVKYINQAAHNSSSGPGKISVAPLLQKEDDTIGIAAESLTLGLAAASADSEGNTSNLSSSPSSVDDRSARMERWEQVADFPEVPAGRLAASSWSLVRYDAWNFTDGIRRFEARALERGLSRFAQTLSGRNIRVVSLCATMAVTLAVSRSRARDFEILVQIRRINAWCLLRNIRSYVRWVPSELNPSDRGSRHVGAEYTEFKGTTIAIDRLSSGLKPPSSAPVQASEARRSGRGL